MYGFLSKEERQITKGQEGIESLALAVAVEGGTKKMNKTEFATALEKIGTISASAHHMITAKSTCHA